MLINTVSNASEQAYASANFTDRPTFCYSAESSYSSVSIVECSDMENYCQVWHYLFFNTEVSKSEAII